MRFLFVCLLSLTASPGVIAQSLNKMANIHFLNSRAKEAVGSVRIFTNSRTVIEDAAFSESEMGVYIMVKLSSVGKESSTITSEFDPSDIEYVEVVQVEKKSPVGQIKLTLKDPTKKSTTNSKTDGFQTLYEELVYFNYLNIDKDNGEKIRKAFWELKKIYEAKDKQPIQELTDLIPLYKNFWIPENGGTSNTYRLDDVYADGCTLRLFYKQETVTKYGDNTKYHLVEIPFSAIGSISMSNKKSKPNSIILHAAKKKGFDVYDYSKVNLNEVYKNRATIREFPLFIDVTYREKYDEVAEKLKQLVKNCGGKKIKI